MPLPPVDHIYEIAHSLLDAVIDIYATAGVNLPDRQLVAESANIAMDCELVAIGLSRVFRGGPGNTIDPNVSQRCTSIRTAEFHIWIIRCASTPQENGDPPLTGTVEPLSQAIYTDAWVLTNKLQLAAANNTLGNPCDGLLIGELRVHGPEGGYGGVDLTIEWLLGAG